MRHCRTRFGNVDSSHFPFKPCPWNTSREIDHESPRTGSFWKRIKQASGRDLAEIVEEWPRDVESPAILPPDVRDIFAGQVILVS
jgi:hypothetical protein